MEKENSQELLAITCRRALALACDDESARIRGIQHTAVVQLTRNIGMKVIEDIIQYGRLVHQLYFKYNLIDGTTPQIEVLVNTEPIVIPDLINERIYTQAVEHLKDFLSQQFGEDFYIRVHQIHTFAHEVHFSSPTLEHTRKESGLPSIFAPTPPTPPCQYQRSHHCIGRPREENK